MRRIRNNQTMSRREAFSLIEMLVLVAVGGLLAGLVLADLSQDRSKAQQEACANNLKQWGTVFQMYAHDYNSAIMIYYRGQTNYVPTWYSTHGVYGRYWSTNRIANAASEAAMIQAKICPAVQSTNAPMDRTVPTYSMIRPEPATADFRGFFLKEVKQPSELLLMVDSVPTNSQAYIGGNGGSVGDVIAATARHSGGVNLLFCDFHVEWKSGAEVQTNFTKWTTYGSP